MKVKTKELTGEALRLSCLLADDWKIERTGEYGYAKFDVFLRRDSPQGCQRTTLSNEMVHSWEWFGPIIEREHIQLGSHANTPRFNCSSLIRWYAWIDRALGHHYGLTPLIAAMRCFVASKLGEEVDVPEQLIKEF